jgi:hypothetical protein
MLRQTDRLAPVLTAVAFYEVITALHVLAVVFAFGATLAYPVLIGTITRANPRALPALYRALHAISQRVIMPGVAAIVVFGVYLASELHDWHAFFVQWGLGVAIVIGAIEGAYLGPREKQLIEVADRDLAGAPGAGEVTFSVEHDALVRRIGTVGALMDLLVIITIFFMVTHLGA